MKLIENIIHIQMTYRLTVHKEKNQQIERCDERASKHL